MTTPATLAFSILLVGLLAGNASASADETPAADANISSAPVSGEYHVAGSDKLLLTGGVTQIAVGFSSLVVGAPTTTVPNVFGRTLSDAQAALTTAGLTIGTTGSVPIDAPDLEGKAIGTTPASGTQVTRGTVINIQTGHYQADQCGPLAC
jgi:hypothetical protein